MGAVALAPTALAPRVALNSLGRRALGRPTSWLFEDVSLDIPPSSRTFVVGANGSGKSTLLRVVLGLLQPDSGHVTVSNQATLKISYVPQDYRNALCPWLSLSTNLGMALRGDVYATVPEEATKAFADYSARLRLKLELSRYPYQLSGGEQQLFVLIEALIRQPTFLVMDEPFSAVDFGRRELLKETLSHDLARRDCTVLAVTHDFEDAVLLADQILVLAPDSSKVRELINIPWEWPRSTALRSSTAFHDLVGRVISAAL